MIFKVFIHGSFFDYDEKRQSARSENDICSRKKNDFTCQYRQPHPFVDLPRDIWEVYISYDRHWST